MCDALDEATFLNRAVVVDVATYGWVCTARHWRASLVPRILGRVWAGRDSGDRAWQLMLWEEYSRAVVSTLGRIWPILGRPAGSITAACFVAVYQSLQRAHLDIAPVRRGKRQRRRDRPPCAAALTSAKSTPMPQIDFYYVNSDPTVCFPAA